MTSESMKISINSILSKLTDILKTFQRKLNRFFEDFIDIHHANTDITAKGVLESLQEAGFMMPTKHVKVTWFKNVGSFGGYSYHIPLIFQYINVGMHWKDKWDTPRYEGGSIFGPCPAYIITIFKLLRIVIYWEAPINPNDRHPWYTQENYWEMWLWYHFYCDKDIKKAKETWPWTSDDKSTWDEYFVPGV